MARHATASCCGTRPRLSGRDSRQAWIKGAAIQAAPTTRRSREHSDLDRRVQEVRGSNPLSSIRLGRPWMGLPSLIALRDPVWSSWVRARRSQDQGGCYPSSPRHEAVKRAPATLTAESRRSGDRIPLAPCRWFQPPMLWVRARRSLDRGGRYPSSPRHDRLHGAGDLVRRALQGGRSHQLSLDSIWSSRLPRSSMAAVASVRAATIASVFCWVRARSSCSACASARWITVLVTPAVRNAIKETPSTISTAPTNRPAVVVGTWSP